MIMEVQEQVVKHIENSKIVPLFNHNDEKLALKIIEVTYNAGVRVIEFTNRSNNAFNVFSYLIKSKVNFPDLALGIGTIFDAETTKKYLDVGADFIVSPIIKPAMAEVCLQYNRLWMPGCGTVTEIALAKELGAQIIKVFPGATLGPQFVSAVLSVMPDVKLMISGGVEVNEQNLRSWFKAGAFCVGIGSQIFSEQILSTSNWPLLEAKLREAICIVNK
jgi:2-dehydro-3-deoxyphosphogluconate aldolase / (4S)-4-hydroxy-2-oxoglutarate aldolase